jgi:hypothetical protein
MKPASHYAGKAKIKRALTRPALHRTVLTGSHIKQRLCLLVLLSQTIGPYRLFSSILLFRNAMEPEVQPKSEKVLLRAVFDEARLLGFLPAK